MAQWPITIFGRDRREAQVVGRGGCRGAAQDCDSAQFLVLNSHLSQLSQLSHLSQLSLSTKLAEHAFSPPASWLCTEFLILYKNSAKIANDSITMKIRKIIRNNPGTMNIHHSSADIVRSGEKRCPAKMYWPLSLRGMGQISMIKAPNLWHKLCST